MMRATAKVLVVDDDADLLKLVSIRLQSAGFEVATADSGERALAILSASTPQVVVTDLRMGGMDGMALFDQIHRSNPVLPVIILTAHGTIPDAVAATQRGVFGYLTKPFDGKDLVTQVTRAVNLSAPVTTDDISEEWKSGIVTRNPEFEAVLSRAKLVATGDASVLIRGESGTGKELLAQAIHRASPRRDQPFMAINCGAIPEALLESELFGHVKGAFTGAARDHEGLFQSANGGTVFLDEIGDMPVALQVKLLRVLQERTVRPVGATQSAPVDVRIVSATHRDLDAAIREGQFREDLYYRLNVVSFTLPPLRDRREDVPLLAGHFLTNIARKYGKTVNAFSADALQRLVKYDWPGNVRELVNVVEQVVALTTSAVVSPALVESALRIQATELDSFEQARGQFERDYLARLLKMTSGNVTHAARLAKRNRTEFYKLLHRHHLDPGLFKALT
ncbi:MAG: sigma 54-interacting transcriptional regulator [Burkholderiales bacterium]|nr:sigma 54-interacting transcriptional regulator [Burkholderiales bacterium]